MSEEAGDVGFLERELGDCEQLSDERAGTKPRSC